MAEQHTECEVARMYNLNERNHRLLLAAPKLLTALKRIRDSGIGIAHQVAEAAINEAERKK